MNNERPGLVKANETDYYLSTGTTHPFLAWWKRSTFFSISFNDIGVENQEDCDQKTGLLPRQFIFYLGTYSGGSCMVRWDGTSILVEKTEGGNFSGSSRRCQPDEGQWREFWRRVQDIGVWSWEQSYTAPHGCCGATYWLLTLSRGGRTLISAGEDRFPDGKGPGFSQVFIALTDAIKVLCRNNIL